MHSYTPFTLYLILCTYNMFIVVYKTHRCNGHTWSHLGLVVELANLSFYVVGLSESEYDKRYLTNK